MRATPPAASSPSRAEDQGQVPGADASLSERVQYLLDTEINPMLASHKGRVALETRRRGRRGVLRFGGGCMVAAWSTSRLMNGIEKTMRERIPGSFRDTLRHRRTRAAAASLHPALNFRVAAGSKGLQRNEAAMSGWNEECWLGPGAVGAVAALSTAIKPRDPLPTGVRGLVRGGSRWRTCSRARPDGAAWSGASAWRKTRSCRFHQEPPATVVDWRRFRTKPSRSRAQAARPPPKPGPARRQPPTTCRCRSSTRKPTQTRRTEAAAVQPRRQPARARRHARQAGRAVRRQAHFSWQIPHMDDAKKYFDRNPALVYEETRFEQYYAPDPTR
jgi:Fe-S cluster biogenesis protein NfuA